ncbi:hypothetical protein LTR36_007278 [Oleoguttula mirabilis]|uniref:DNA repair protein RAD50 n=1 Tax=Oleoguttula mirabilis TaxID=1507867 RepID=A0AAV9J9Y7_9PEZI|nr:hypothetical protein LTR36_007278 [Oleoguttula mirabilis]
MSMIDKLSILGVRSFDNTRSETIKFHSPLTLIVGTNGSGKTTIIECLKYVTTGEMPPNTKVGGAFIHDPKLCGEKEVLAQVKVSFKSQKGVRMVCTRNLQLTVKKNTRSMKTLEGTLETIRDGERFSMSSRVAEIDELMPEYLGVSKAILESVIFCHQDHSLWPMAAPGDLKKQFDEIFEALKYTKAIDNIKIMAKNQKIELGKFQIEQVNAKTNKDRGKKIEKQAEKLSAECDDLRKSHEDYDDRIKQAARNVEAAWEKAQKAGNIVGELTGKRIEKRTKEESVESLRQNLTEMSEQDEDLQRMLEEYEERVDHSNKQLDTKKARYQEFVGEVQQARNQVSAKEREVGSYEAQAESYERQMENRVKLVKETARSHNIRGFDLEVDDNQVRAFMERISKMARDQNAAFERARRETQDELQRAQKVLNQINEQKSALNQRKESSRQTITANDRKINTLQGELNRINIDEGGKAAMESSLRETETRLDKAKSDMEAASWDAQASSTEAELRKLDNRKEKLDAELIEGTRQAGESARLDFVQKELKDRESRLETMQGAYKERIAALVGDDWTPDTVEAAFQNTVQQSSSHVMDAERQRDGTSREKEQLDYQLNTCRRDLKSKQQAIKSAADHLNKKAEVEPDKYQEELQVIETSREALKRDIDALPELKRYLKACIKTARDSHKCKTCMRGFEHKKDADGLVRSLEAMIKEKEAELGKAPQELKEFEEDLAKFKAVAGDFETWERLKEKEIPALQKQESELAAKREKLIEQLENQDIVVNERQSAKRDIEAMARTVQTIAKHDSEVSAFKGQIQELLAKQKAAGLSRGLEQVQSELKKLNEESRTIKARLSKITGDRDRARSTLNSLELELRDTKGKLSTAEYQLREKLSLGRQVDELKGLTNDQRENMKSMDSELKDLGPQLSQAQAKYDDIARRGADKDRELQTEANKLNSSLNQLKMANQEIDAYHGRDGPGQLKRGKREVEALKKEVGRLEQEQRAVIGEVKALEDQLRNHAETKRSISDNQRYRRDLRQLTQVRKDIEELETHNAEEDKNRYEKEGGKWQMQRNKLAAEQATVIGSLKSKDETLVTLLADYDTEYKDAARKYKEAHVRVETTKACVEDLGRYGGALDKAIMKYHSIKMEEINRIVDELWRKTYQGTDVDTILIRSESENSKSNKSYNYRVCMIKQDAEMDMRGRCSAGQKVLASIIIRLALAECFGVNCGLIALDEPTTNLDRDNIRALANSLSEIIKVRRQQKNFQLIVITHDEEFLRYMGCSDFADVYYRVSRSDTQKSIIERQSIADVL